MPEENNAQDNINEEATQVEDTQEDTQTQADNEQEKKSNSKEDNIKALKAIISKQKQKIQELSQYSKEDNVDVTTLQEKIKTLETQVSEENEKLQKQVYSNKLTELAVENGIDIKHIKDGILPILLEKAGASFDKESLEFVNASDAVENLKKQNSYLFNSKTTSSVIGTSITKSESSPSYRKQVKGSDISVLVENFDDVKEKAQLGKL